MPTVTVRSRDLFTVDYVDGEGAEHTFDRSTLGAAISDMQTILGSDVEWEKIVEEDDA